MTPQVLQHTNRVTTQKEMSYVVIREGMLAYQIVTTTTVDGRDPTRCTVEGIASPKCLEEFQRNAPISEYRMDRGAIIGTPALREHLRLYGWLNNDIYDMFRQVSDPFTAFVNGRATVDDVILLNVSENMAYDADDLPLPVAIMFSYIDGRMDNRTYDLEKALQILRARTDIRFELEDRWVKRADSIQSIPGYNQDSGRTHCLRFVWTPDTDSFHKMWAWCVSNRKKKDSWAVSQHRAVFELDLLGLRAGGAARSEDYYG